MLVLSRNIGDKIIIGRGNKREHVIKVAQVKGNKAKLVIETKSHVTKGDDTES